jgi:predicted lipoprotein with Yx(FWY)xxD motif
MVRRSLCLFAAGLAALTVLAASASVAAAASGTKVDLSTTKLGPILTTGAGYTLFAFTKDTPNMDNCVTTPGCPIFWPPLLTNGAPIAGTGVDASLLGSVSLPSGKTQVSYNGYPLYGYIFDLFPRATYYVGISAFGGTWEAVTASGTLLK